MKRMRHQLIATLGVLCLGIALAALAGAGAPNPGVALPNVNPHLAQAWWEWAAAVEYDTNPLNDGDPYQGQSNGIFFLAGALDGVAHERDVTVKVGTPLFFPVINSAWWAPDDLATAELWAAMEGLPVDEMTDEELLRFIAAYSVQAYEGQPPLDISVTLDGQELIDPENLEKYRAASNKLFELEETPLFGDLPGRLYAADGYWVFLNPLKVGEHTLHITGEIVEGPFVGFTVDVTYNITVER